MSTTWTAVALDFATKQHRNVSIDEVKTIMSGSGDRTFVWIDVDVTQIDEAKEVLAKLPGTHEPEMLEDALTREPATQIGRYDNYIHLVMSGCRLVGHKFDLERVDVMFGERFMLTLHRGAPVFLEGVRKSYITDFVRFAQSPSFLLFELWDHLIDNYLSVHKVFEERVDDVQRRLIGNVNEAVFDEASEVGADLLHLRKVVLPARTVLADLSTRKSAFVSEATQPYLANMIGTVERVLQDVLVDRDILSGSLNNYMSRVAHKSNQTVSKLTAVSIIFMPLTFICGVYGMNFDVLPELHLKYGYLGFWIVVVALAGILLVVMRRNKLF